MPKFNFTDDEFLVFVNTIYRKEMPIGDEFTPITSMEESILPRLDSLGMMVFFTWVTEAFGIPENVYEAYLSKKPTYTITEISEFIRDSATQTLVWESGSLEEMIEGGLV